MNAIALLIALPVLCLTVVYVPHCDQQKLPNLHFFDQDGSSDNQTLAVICHTQDELKIRWNCTDSDIISTYNKCNDPLYKQDVVEIFIATDGSYPYNYFEFEVSPKGQLFFSDITNPSGNCSSFSGRRYPCDPITYHASISSQGYWTADLSMKLDIIGRGSKLEYFLINVFRIDVSRDKPTRYLAWHPTYTPTPCFHVPNVFETIRLI